jgi:hypothetical protein
VADWVGPLPADSEIAAASPDAPGREPNPVQRGFTAMMKELGAATS